MTKKRTMKKRTTKNATKCTTRKTKSRLNKDKKETKKNADIRYREYWRDNERFADLFNTVVFGGEVVLNPEELEESDTRVMFTMAFR